MMTTPRWRFPHPNGPRLDWRAVGTWRAVLAVLLLQCWFPNLGHAQAVKPNPETALCKEHLRQLRDRTEASKKETIQSLQALCQSYSAADKFLGLVAMSLRTEDLQASESWLRMYRPGIDQAARDAKGPDALEEEKWENALTSELKALNDRKLNAAKEKATAAERLIARNPVEAIRLFKEAAAIHPSARIWLAIAEVHSAQNQTWETETALKKYDELSHQDLTPSERQRYERLRRELAQKLNDLSGQIAALHSQADQATNLPAALAKLRLAYQLHAERSTLMKLAEVCKRFTSPALCLEEVELYYAADPEAANLRAQFQDQMGSVALIIADAQSTAIAVDGRPLDVGKRRFLAPGTHRAELTTNGHPPINLAIYLRAREKAEYTVFVRPYQEAQKVVAGYRATYQWARAIEAYRELYAKTLPDVAEATAESILLDVTTGLITVYAESQQPREGLALLHKNPNIDRADELERQLKSQLATVRFRVNALPQGSEATCKVDDDVVYRSANQTVAEWEWKGNPGSRQLNFTADGYSFGGKCLLYAGSQSILNLAVPFPDRVFWAKVRSSKAMKQPWRYLALAFGTAALAAGGALIAVDGRQDCAYGTCARALDTRAGGIASLSIGGGLFIVGTVGVALDIYLRRHVDKTSEEIRCP